MNSIGYVLDAKKKIYELHFLPDGQIKMFNFGRNTSEICSFTGFHKLPGWIKDGLNGKEVMGLLKSL